MPRNNKFRVLYKLFETVTIYFVTVNYPFPKITDLGRTTNVKIVLSLLKYMKKTLEILENALLLLKQKPYN